MKILDCTFRDGGYYTNWDFNPNVVDTYLASINNLPIEYIEIGYRSAVKKGYYGEFFYCPTSTLKRIRKSTDKKIAILIDEKDTDYDLVGKLLEPCFGVIDMVRIAVAPERLSRSVTLAKQIKAFGFEVGFNVMYMSNWEFDTQFIDTLKSLEGVADYFYMVDSYGGVFPNDVKEICQKLKQETQLKLGFHGHNNLELGLINTITAIENGAELVDVTVAGMGRGAGNLSTELLLTVLASKGLIAEFNFDELSKLVEPFYKLKEEYKWGTNLPYIFSGANSMPQKEVMEWVGKRYYSFNSIVRALSNQSKGLRDNRQLPKYHFNDKKIEKVIVIGGGDSATKHAAALKQYLTNNPDIPIIHASSKNALITQDLPNTQFYCLIGNEGVRMEDVFSKKLPANAICILPPFPRKMGTYIPKAVLAQSYELPEFNFNPNYIDSLSAVAMQFAIELKASHVELIGYDGYAGLNIGIKEQDLLKENAEIFKDAKRMGLNIYSLSETNYKGLDVISIYALL